MAGETMQSVERLFVVVEAMAQKETVGVRELKTITGLNTTTIHRILSSLLALGYVIQNQETDKYMLTYKWTALGNAVYKKNSIVQLVHPYLKELAEKIGDTVHFAERVDNNIRYIDKITPSSGIFAIGSFPGMELPIPYTGLGKAMLSKLPEDEVNRIWEEREQVVYTDKTILDIEVLKKELHEARETGFAYDREEREVGIFCIATNIPDYSGGVRYALSVSTSAGNMTEENLTRIKGLLLEGKKELMRLMGRKE